MNMNMRHGTWVLAILAILTVAAFAQDAAKPSGTPPDHWLAGTSDVKDMVPATVAPDAPRKLLAEHGPAYLEQIGNIRVMHLKGSYRDMGFQHGTLLKSEIEAMCRLMVKVGTEDWEKDFAASMKEAWSRTSKFVPDKFKEEIQGMAEATGIPVDTLNEFNVFPELFHCSGFAMWGKATADASLLHARVLDYMRDAGLDQYAVVIIQEPDNAHAFLNVTYAGFLGSVTGMNDQQLGMGEMGGAGGENWDGMPMAFLLREVLETATTIEDMRRIIETTPRTCQYFYVISDAKAGNGRGAAYGVATTPLNAAFIKAGEVVPLLPVPVEDAVLMTAGDRYWCLVRRTQKMYGKITPEIALDIMARGVSMESNTHNALFKPATSDCWVSYATPGTPSCNLPYTHINMGELMKSKPGK